MYLLAPAPLLPKYYKYPLVRVRRQPLPSSRIAVAPSVVGYSFSATFSLSLLIRMSMVYFRPHFLCWTNESVTALPYGHVLRTVLLVPFPLALLLKRPEFYPEFNSLPKAIGKCSAF